MPIIMLPCIEQLAGAMKVVVIGPQLLKVYPSIVVMLGMVAVASQRKLEIDSGETEMTWLHRKEYKASSLWRTRTGPKRTTGITISLE
jgi:hypothetical protein